MAKIDIGSALIKIDPTEGGANAADYSSEIISGTLTLTRGNSKHKTLGGTGAFVTVGDIEGSVSIVVEANTGATALASVLGSWISDNTPTARSLEISTPNSTDVGAQKYTFEAFLVSLTPVEADANGTGVMRLAAQFESDGAITFANVT